MTEHRIDWAHTLTSDKIGKWIVTTFIVVMLIASGFFAGISYMTLYSKQNLQSGIEYAVQVLIPARSIERAK